MQNSTKALPNSLWFRAIVFALLYLCLSRLSAALSFQGASFASLWLPGGLFVAMLLLSPIEEWPVILLSALPVQLLDGVLQGQPLLNSLVIYLSGALEAATGAWLVRRFDLPPGKLITPAHVLNLVIFSAIFSSAISATINTTAALAQHSGLAFWSTWQVAWISHALGILVIAPLVLAWSDVHSRSLHIDDPERLIELVILITGLVICTLDIFAGSFGLTRQTYIIIPFFVWVALRFGARGTSLCGLIVTLIATWGTTRQIDAFANSDITIAPNLASLGSFLAITLVTSYILATVWDQAMRSEKAMRESEERYRLLVENQAEGVGILDQKQVFRFANPVALQIFGVESLVGRSLKDFTSPEQYQQALKQANLQRAGEKTTFELEIIQPGSKRRNLLVSATPEYDQRGQWEGAFAIFHDQTEQKQAEMALRDSRARFQVLFDHSPIPIWEEDFSRVKRLLDGFKRDGVEDFREFFTRYPEKLEICSRMIRVLDVNQAVLQQNGFSDKAQFMAQVDNLMHRGPNDLFIAEMGAIAEGKTEFDMEGPNDMLDGLIRYHAVRWNVAPGYEKDFRRVIVTITDVTERRQAEERMRYLSTHDVLTGLYNRNFFEAELERLQNSRLEPINVMVVDVNGMKSTNDTFGHAAGDDLLRRTAQVLRMSFRKEDVIARIGGDEFVVLFQGTLPLLEAIKRVKDCESEHNHWYDGPALSLAIGAATGGKGSSLVELFKKADQQMYKEKVHTGRLRSIEKIEKDDPAEEKPERTAGKFPMDHQGD